MSQSLFLLISIFFGWFVWFFCNFWIPIFDSLVQTICSLVNVPFVIFVRVSTWNWKLFIVFRITMVLPKFETGVPDSYLYFKSNFFFFIGGRIFRIFQLTRFDMRQIVLFFRFFLFGRHVIQLFGWHFGQPFIQLFGLLFD